jgi:hypothetical protein
MTTRWERDAAMLTRRVVNSEWIRIGSVETCGPVTEEDREVIDAGGASRLDRFTVALVATAAFDAYTRHATVVVGTGRTKLNYTLRDFRRVDDGLLTELYLARTAP